jgi:hypothetical protein
VVRAGAEGEEALRERAASQRAAEVVVAPAAPERAAKREAEDRAGAPAAAEEREVWQPAAPAESARVVWPAQREPTTREPAASGLAVRAVDA